MKSFFSSCTNKWFWVKERFSHPTLGRCWKDALAVEEMSRAELERFCFNKRTRLLRHAATTVPFYRTYFSDKRICLDNLYITDFPIISKSDIRGHEEEFTSDSVKVDYWSRTSGSTGEPFKFGKTKTEFDYTYATLWRGMRRFGVLPGMKRAFVKGIYETLEVPILEKVKASLRGTLNRCVYIDAHFLAASDDNVKRAIRRLLGYRPLYLHGFVSTLYHVAQYIDTHHVDISPLKLIAVFTESEKCYDYQRELLERVFQARVVEHYGCVEFGMVAQPAGDGTLCVNEDHVYLETTPEGEAVLTNLDEYAFPLIRFKNGDLLEIGDVHKTLPYMTVKGIDGRKTDTIKLPQGGQLHGFIPMYPVSKHARLMRAYQIYQPSIDRLIVRIVPNVVNFPEDVREMIVSEMRDVVGEKMQIEIHLVDDIPLSKRGKRLFICSDVKETK